MKHFSAALALGLLLTFVGSTQQKLIDYNSQIGNKPRFGRGFVSEINSKGAETIHVDAPYYASVETVPVVDDSNPLVLRNDGSCRYIWRGINMGSAFHPTLLLTPTKSFACVPSGEIGKRKYVVLAGQ